MIDLSNLIVTHNRLRNPSKLRDLVKLPEINKLLVTRPIPIIHIVQMRFYKEVPMYFVRDCHHAAVAVLHHRLVNKLSTILDEKEYTLEEFSFQDLWIPNPSVGWVTPFNPITHVRKDNFFNYKCKMMEFIKKHGTSEELNRHIVSCHEEYREERNIWTVYQLYIQHKEEIHAEEKDHPVGINAY